MTVVRSVSFRIKKYRKWFSGPIIFSTGGARSFDSYGVVCFGYNIQMLFFRVALLDHQKFGDSRRLRCSGDARQWRGETVNTSIFDCSRVLLLHLIIAALFLFCSLRHPPKSAYMNVGGASLRWTGTAGYAPISQSTIRHQQHFRDTQYLVRRPHFPLRISYSCWEKPCITPSRKRNIT